jgi:pimeloyl-ACP methyl ester carboxylesterase
MSQETMLLVHGAWHGAWCWEKIASTLAQRGKRVLTPDLPGHGKHLQPPQDVTLARYVEAIVTVVKMQPHPVTLVGHSMGGIIISQVAEHIPDRIKALIFVAAYIPKHNESLLTMASQSRSHHIVPHLVMDTTMQTVTLKKSSELIPIFFNCCTPHDAERAMEGLQPQPMRPWQETVHLGQAFDRVPKLAIISQQDRAIPTPYQLKMAQAVTQHIHQIEADHAIYYSGADKLIELLGRAMEIPARSVRG